MSEDIVALVTGGGTGIGEATARLLVDSGARVFLTGRRAAPLQALAAELGPRVAWVSADIGHSGEPERIVGAVREAFGGLDILINNAGTSTDAGVLLETSDEELERVFRVNTLGTLAMTREALPALIERGGSVVNVSSVLAQGVMAGSSAYAASKAAIEQATRVIAAEVGPLGVRVNAVSPGLTATDMAAPLLENEVMLGAIKAQTPLGRVADPIEVARAIVWLTRPDAGWVTGQVLQASGGFLL